MNFKASEVFEKMYSAINETKIVDGRDQRKYTIIIHEGSSRSTKTWSIYQMLWMHGLYNRRKRIVVLRDTKEDCRDKVEPDFIKWYHDPMARINQYKDGLIDHNQLEKHLKKESFAPLVRENKTNHKHTFKHSKSVIHFTGADDEDRAIGKAQDVLWINEPYVFSEDIFKELNQRTSDFVIIDWNPRFDHWIDKLKLRDDCIVIHSTFLDNGFLSHKETNELQSYQPLSHKYISGVEHINLTGLLKLTKEQVSKHLINSDPVPTPNKRKEIIRCWTNEKQKTADKYRWEVYGLGIKSEKPNKIYHGWESISEAFFNQINEPIYYGLDLGITAPTSCNAIKYRENCIFIHELIYAPGQEIESLSWALEKSGVDKNRPLVCDRTVRGTEHSDSLNLLDLHASGFGYAIPAIKGKGSVFNGIEAIQKCRVYVTNSSQNVWQEYYGYEFSKYNGQITDQPVKRDDHAMDSVRMAFNYLRIELGVVI